MALPANYKQIAVNMPSGSGSQSGHMMSPSVPASFNILKERLRAPGSGSTSERNKEAPSIFTHNNHCNPAFTPQKTGKISANIDTRVPKPPKPPEKPIMPYMRYSKKIWDSVKTANPDLKLWEIGKKIGAMWKAASDSEKQEFIDEYEAEKVKYQEALKIYHSSPEYLAWIKYKTKQRVNAESDVHETPTRGTSKSQQDRRIDIQPAEDEDDQDDGYSIKHIAYARFLRNHRLINEIFSDAVVPDVRSVITTQRMQVLKRQVTSLTMHQTKLEAELQQMEEKFETKKRKLVESSENFQEELKKHCKPAVDEETFQNMVQRIYEEMKTERQKMLENPPQIQQQQLKPPMEDAKQLQNTLQASLQAHQKSLLAPLSPQVNQSDNQKPPFVSQQQPEPMDIEPSKPTTTIVPPPSHILKVPQLEKHKPLPLSPSSKESTHISESPISSKASRKADKAETHIPVTKDYPEKIEPPSTQIQSPHTLTPAHEPPSVTISQQASPISHHIPPPPPPHHMSPHINPHQAIAGHPGIPHPTYGAYSSPPRAPYYPPQYGGHPPQPYGQYSPYSYHQQYGPAPPSHYISTRPPIHFPEHSAATIAAQQPPSVSSSMDTHHGTFAASQMGAAPSPNNGDTKIENEQGNDGEKRDAE